MTVRFLKPCVKQYQGLLQQIRKKLDRQLKTLSNDFKHPSLHTKKIKGRVDIWEARIDYHYRFTFKVIHDMAIIRAIGPHDVLKKL